jgi:transcriptional regulator with XRE-family HTH domain
MAKNVRPAKKAGNPIDQHVGGRVRMRRMMLGMSQSTLGEKLSVTFQQVQKYEKGSNRIGASRLQLISDVLEAPISFFFDGAPGAGTGKRDEESAVLTSFAASADGLALIRAFSKVTDKELRTSIVRLVTSIAETDRQGGD